MMCTTFSERMKLAMEIKDIKQADIVEKTKIGKSSISQYLSGMYEPKQKNIFLIARALGVSEAWLMGYDVPMEPSVVNSYRRLTKEQTALLNSFSRLNTIGKVTALKRVEELTYIDKYIEKDYLSPVAAHAKNKASKDDIKHDLDIMDDDNW